MLWASVDGDQVVDERSPGFSTPNEFAPSPTTPTTALQLPPTASSSTRPQSAIMYTSPTIPQHESSPGVPSRKRASHSVASPTAPIPSLNSVYPDVYAHPAAVAYAAAHPRRQIPRFGPYLLLQTLGEGEFGKVKLGLHGEWGEEVAVKLIRRGSVDNPLRMSKVEREIEVLRTIKHPNIVRLYDVIETDKYIGIVLEYASGGELFDHILAHRFLREKDASKLFAQLISGVSYCHAKKIVHRDLKLENLLLDRNRNVIITDFGFANRFEHRADDLMQTSCGSPCYAAPELVISEGLYVGSAVDIWSCGVILYAMLAGYLPFDDDPANPDGDNINLLYKYIINTPLTFPDYISAEARDLLSIMLVPDPAKRSDLKAIMSHPWLSAYSGLFRQSVRDLEHAAHAQQQEKRTAYQRQMRERVLQQQQPQSVSQPQIPSPQRDQRHDLNSSTRNRSGRQGQSESQADTYYESAEPALYSSPPRRGVTNSLNIPLTPSTPADNDFPYIPDYQRGTEPIDPRTRKESTRSRSSKRATPASPNIVPMPGSTEKKRRTGGQRHTIQLEYDSGFSQGSPAPPTPSKHAGSPRHSPFGEEVVPPRTASPVPLDPGDATHIPGSPSDTRISSRSMVNGTLSGASRSPRRDASLPQTNGETSPTSAPISIPKATSPSVKTPPSSPQNTPRVNGVSDARPSSPASPRIRQKGTSSSPDLPRTPVLKPTAALPQADVAPSAKAASPGASIPAAQAGQATAATPQQPAASSTNVSIGSATKVSDSSTQNGGSVSGSVRHRRGFSLDKFGLGKLLSNQQNGLVNGLSSPISSVPAARDNALLAATGPGSKPPTTGPKKKNGGQTLRNRLSATLSRKPSSDAASAVSEKSAKKARRTTLSSLMIDPLSKTFSNRARSASRARPPVVEKVIETPRTADLAFPELLSPVEPPASATIPLPRPAAAAPTFDSFRNGPSTAPGVSTGKAKKVMDWFRKKSLAKSDSTTVVASEPPPEFTYTSQHGPATPQVVITTPGDRQGGPWPGARIPSGNSANSDSTGSRAGAHKGSAMASSVTSPTLVSEKVAVQAPAFNKALLRIHRGAVDQATITNGSPPLVFENVSEVLRGMGIEFVLETPFKYRCLRPKRRKDGHAPSSGLTAFQLSGSAASNGTDKRGLPLPSHHSLSGTGGMLKGFLSRRGSSQVPSNLSTRTQSTSQNLDVHDFAPFSPTISESPKGPQNGEEPSAAVLYGDSTQDTGDEVRFSVELTRMDRLEDTYSLDIRRLKGHLRSYKYLYDTLRDRCDFPH